MMKRIFTLLLLVVIVFSVASCGSDNIENNKKKTDKKRTEQTVKESKKKNEEENEKYNSEEVEEIIERKNIYDILGESLAIGVEIDGVKYDVYENMAAISWIVDKEGEISETIEYEGKVYPVLAISNEYYISYESAFPETEELTVPPFIKYMLNGFTGCHHVKTVTIPATVECISGRWFSGCENLETINYETSWNMKEWTKNEVVFGSVYFGCSNLKKAFVPEPAEKLMSSFADCTSLEEITYPDTIKVVGLDSYKNCNSLRNLDILSSGVYVNGDLEIENKYLEDLAITNYGGGTIASRYTENLVIEFDEPYRNLSKYTVKCPSLKTLTISNSATDLIVEIDMDGEAFSLERVIIPDRENIELFVNLYVQDELPNFTLEVAPEYVEKMQAKYPTLTVVEYNKKMTSIFDGAMRNQYVKENEKSIEEIDKKESTKRNIYDIMGKNVAHRVEYQGVLYDVCENLAIAKDIKDEAGAICEAIEYDGKTYPVLAIGTGYFSHWSFGQLEEIEIPSFIKYLPEENTFNSKENLKRITIPSSIEYVKWHGLFSYCHQLETVINESSYDMHEWDDKLNNMNWTYNHCENLKNVIIPEGVTSLTGYSFCNCKEIEEIDYPDSLKEIDLSIFENCNKLKNLDVLKSCSAVYGTLQIENENLKDLTICNYERGVQINSKYTENLILKGNRACNSLQIACPSIKTIGVTDQSVFKLHIDIDEESFGLERIILRDTTLLELEINSYPIDNLPNFILEVPEESIDRMKETYPTLTVVPYGSR